MDIEGYYLDGKTSRRIPATLSSASGSTSDVQIKLKPADTAHELLNIAVDDLTIRSRLGNTPREILFFRSAVAESEQDTELENVAAQLFVTDDNDAIDELLNFTRSSRVAGGLHRLETHLGIIVFATLATIAVMWGISVYGIPKAAELIAYQMPEFVNEQLGDSLDVLDGTLLGPSTLDQTRQDAIRELVNSYLVAHDELKPRINFRTGLQANALALPGGDIVLTDELVKLAENDQELLAVFFHELGHLKHRHTTRRALQGAMVTLLVVFTVGDVNSIDLLTAFPALIADLSYSRRFETEADTYALDQMRYTGIELDHFANIMQRLEAYYRKPAGSGSGESAEDNEVHKNSVDPDKGSVEKETRGQRETREGARTGVPEFLSTHPATENRIELVEKYKRTYGLL